ncbi:MAG: hypothetical protein PHV51_04325, partial [Methanosarcinaceae archaeon]|nr:hypothetical protein [Methanosarcinaceae archaeon]
MNRIKLMIGSLLVLFLLVGSASAAVTIEKQPAVMIEQNKTVKANSDYVDMANFTLNATAGELLQTVKIKFNKASSSVTGNEIKEIAIFNDTGKIVVNDTNIDLGQSMTFNIDGYAVSPAGTEFIIKMKTDSSWSDNGGADADAISIYMGAGKNTFTFNSDSPIAEELQSNLVWIADTTDPIISGPVYNHTYPFSLNANDFVMINVTFPEKMYEVKLTINDTGSNEAVINTIGSIVVLNQEMTEGKGNEWYYIYSPNSSENCSVDVSFTGKDLASNSFTPEIDTDAFVIDNIDPQASLISPKNSNKYVATSTPTFNFTASDNWGSILGWDYDLYIDNKLVDKANYTESKAGENNEYTLLTLKDEAALSDEKHKWKIIVTDAAGNEKKPGNVNFYVDTEVPNQLALNCPEEGALNKTSNTLSFNFTANDSLTYKYKSELSLTYELYVDSILKKSGTITEPGASQAVDLYVADGAHNWTVSVKDKANNELKRSANFTVDTSGPTVELVKPLSETECFGNSGDFKFNYSDSDSNLALNYKLLINGLEWKNGTIYDTRANAGNDNFTITVDNLPGGDGVVYNWTVNITDYAGRSVQPDAKNFKIDSKAPEHVAGLFIEDTRYESRNLTVKWNKSEAEDLQNYIVYFSTSNAIKNVSELPDDVKAESITLSKDVNSTFLNVDYNGLDYYVAVVSKDKVGNYNDTLEWAEPVKSYEEMALSVEKGWNLVSVPKRLLDPDKEEVFGSCLVLYYNTTSGDYDFVDLIEPCKGYWVDSGSADDITLTFEPMPLGGVGELPLSVDLVAGWNMIGPTSTTEMKHSNALKSIETGYSNLLSYDATPGVGWDSVLKNWDG